MALFFCKIIVWHSCLYLTTGRAERHKGMTSNKGPQTELDWRHCWYVVCALTSRLLGAISVCVSRNLTVQVNCCLLHCDLNENCKLDCIFGMLKNLKCCFSNWSHMFCVSLSLFCGVQRQQKIQRDRLMNDFSAALNNFQAVQRRAAQKEKESVARARAGSRLSVSSESVVVSRLVDAAAVSTYYVLS